MPIILLRLSLMFALSQIPSDTPKLYEASNSFTHFGKISLYMVDAYICSHFSTCSALYIVSHSVLSNITSLQYDVIKAQIIIILSL